MTRLELIRILTDKHRDLSCQVVEESVKHIFDLMAKALGKGERIELRGFGCFSLRYRAPRVARNPKTGQVLMTNSKYVVHFKPGKELRLCVNKIHDYN